MHQVSFSRGYQIVLYVKWLFQKLPRWFHIPVE